MRYLLDANVLIACGWQSHQDHHAAGQWLAATREFATCPVVQMAFLRVSMSQAFGASFAEASESLQTIVSRLGHAFLRDEVEARRLPPVMGNKEVTDAHLVTLAGYHGCKLATLDKPLCTKPWAQGIAEYIA